MVRTEVKNNLGLDDGCGEKIVIPRQRKPVAMER